jgi:hypothetical protein
VRVSRYNAVEETPPTGELDHMIEPVATVLLEEFPSIDPSIAIRIVLARGDFPDEAIEFFLLERLELYGITTIRDLEELVNEYYTLKDFSEYVYNLHNPPVKQKKNRKKHKYKFRIIDIK